MVGWLVGGGADGATGTGVVLGGGPDGVACVV